MKEEKIKKKKINCNPLRIKRKKQKELLQMKKIHFFMNRQSPRRLFKRRSGQKVFNASIIWISL